MNAGPKLSLQRLKQCVSASKSPPWFDTARGPLLVVIAINQCILCFLYAHPLVQGRSHMSGLLTIQALARRPSPQLLGTGAFALHAECKACC